MCSISVLLVIGSTQQVNIVRDSSDQYEHVEMSTYSIVKQLHRDATWRSTCTPSLSYVLWFITTELSSLTLPNQILKALFHFKPKRIYQQFKPLSLYYELWNFLLWCEYCVFLWKCKRVNMMLVTSHGMNTSKDQDCDRGILQFNKVTWKFIAWQYKSSK